MDQNTSPISPRAKFVPRTTTFVPKSTNGSSQSNGQKSNQTNSFQPKNNIGQSIGIQPKTQGSLPDSNDTKSNRKSFVVFKNDMIKARTIRLVDDEGTILGTYPRDEVLKMGEDQGLDVVQVHYDADTMICTAKMFDRGKYQYEKKKSDSAKRKTISKGLKEIKFKFAIGENDLKLKIRKAKEFFAEGYGVRFVTTLKGREKSNAEVVLEKFKFIQKDCETNAKGNGIKTEPRGYSMVLMALKNK